MLSAPIKWKRSKRSKKDDDGYKKSGDKYHYSGGEQSNPRPLNSGYHAHQSPSANQLPVIHKEASQVNVPRIKSNQLTAPVRAYVANPDSRHPERAKQLTAYLPVPVPPGTSPSRSLFPVEPISVYPSTLETPAGSANRGSSKLPFDPKDLGYFEQRTEKVTVYRPNSGDDIDGLRRRRSANCQNAKCSTQKTSFIDDTFKPALYSAKEYLHEKRDKAADVLHEAKSGLRSGPSIKCETTKCPRRQTSFIEDTIKPALHSAKEYLHEKKEEAGDVLHEAKSELMRTGSGLSQNIRRVTHKATQKYCPSWYEFVFLLSLLIMLAVIVYLVHELWIFLLESNVISIHEGNCQCQACRNLYRYHRF